MTRLEAGDVARWSAARLYLVISGLTLLVLSAIGFSLDASFPTSPEAVRNTEPAYILGLLETNGWHNLAGVLSAALALGFALRPEWAITGALFKGALYVIVTASIALAGGETFLLASNDADQVVHASLAVGGLATGAATASRRSRNVGAGVNRSTVPRR